LSGANSGKNSPGVPKKDVSGLQEFLRENFNLWVGNGKGYQLRGYETLCTSKEILSKNPGSEYYNKK